MIRAYTTYDAYLAGYLALKGYSPRLQLQSNNRVIFNFTESPNLQSEIMNYNSGAIIEAVRFTLSIKSLKNQIFSMKMENVE